MTNPNLEIARDASKTLNDFKNALNQLVLPDEYINVVNEISNCNGKVVTTGMGKAGIAMQKFSSILCSLGIPSCYLHPGTASHGDLGILSKDDILFVASTSGKTREVLETIDLAKDIGITNIIGITSHADSLIRNKSKIILDIGIIEEAGYLNIAPTTSILIMLVITDCIALSVAKCKGLTREQYSKYHHSGYIGSVARNDKEIY